MLSPTPPELAEKLKISSLTARPSILNRNPMLVAASNCRVDECSVSLSTISITFPASLVTLIVNSGVISSRGGLLSKFAAIFRAPPPPQLLLAPGGNVIVKFSEQDLSLVCLPSRHV